LAQDDYYYEIQLTNKQLVFYFMAGATGLILSFLAGVMVGRGVDAQAGEVQAARGTQEERTIVEETPRPVSPAPSPAELSYAQRLESDKADDSLAKPVAPSSTAPARGASPKPSAISGATPATPAAAPPTPAPREPKAAKPPRPTPEPAAADATTSPTPAPTTARLATREPKEGKEAKAPKGSATAGAFAIQVGAFKDRGSADTVVSRLKGKGFSAFVIPPDGSDGLFLVRVGSFAARADAERTEAKLRDQEKFKPYIVKN
jgi:cell division septation protein DedD